MYIVDRIEDNIVVLEDYDTGRIINVDIKYFANFPKTGSVFNYNGEMFIENIDIGIKRKNELENLFNKLKKE